ncbi:MAG: DUF362 domain-containing protein [Planctomycetes bacterium]|nr:DUF362 domain-containing protein [Planctomycetota bacterium]
MTITEQANRATIEPGVIFRACGGRPAENLRRVIDMMGGIQRFVDSDDVVIIKPNAQWWNQGATNLSALEALVALIMDRPGGFNGEVVIAENCHRGAKPGSSAISAWAQPFVRNADLADVDTLNGLCRQLKQRHDQRFSACHWLDVQNGAQKVSGPAEGLGYVYCDGTDGNALIQCDNQVDGDQFRSTIMTYPVFKTDRGTIVDFKQGIWQDGGYTEQPLKFVNFAALNHHSTYCGATSLVKNIFGVVDLSGGSDPNNNGILTQNYYNFHSFSFNKWKKGPSPDAMGKAVGTFFQNIRKPDLNITAAEWIGLSSRTQPPVAKTEAVLAGTDPVALDYHAFKYLLYPNSNISCHNPDNSSSPVYQDLSVCAHIYGGVFEENNMTVTSYTIDDNQWQPDSGGIIKGKIIWRSKIKDIMKYFYIRFCR